MLAVIYLRPGIAHAVVEGTTPAPFDSHRVFGDGVSIGNTLMENPPPNLQVNTQLLTESSASLSTIPDDAVPQAVYLWWSGNLALGQGAGSVDSDAEFVVADGATINVQADQCRFISASFEGTPQLGFYYCRADVTAFVAAHPGAFSYNGTYTVGDVFADPGRVDQNNPLACAASEQGLCQAKYAAWSMVFIFDSPTTTLQRDVILFDGFVHMDETNSSRTYAFCRSGWKAMCRGPEPDATGANGTVFGLNTPVPGSRFKTLTLSALRSTPNT